MRVGFGVGLGLCLGSGFGLARLEQRAARCELIRWAHAPLAAPVTLGHLVRVRVGVMVSVRVRVRVRVRVSTSRPRAPG